MNRALQYIRGLLLLVLFFVIGTHDSMAIDQDVPDELPLRATLVSRMPSYYDGEPIHIDIELENTSRKVAFYLAMDDSNNCGQSYVDLHIVGGSGEVKPVHCEGHAWADVSDIRLLGPGQQTRVTVGDITRGLRYWKLVPDTYVISGAFFNEVLTSDGRIRKQEINCKPSVFRVIKGKRPVTWKDVPAIVWDVLALVTIVVLIALLCLRVLRRSKCYRPN